MIALAAEREERVLDFIVGEPFRRQRIFEMERKLAGTIALIMVIGYFLLISLSILLCNESLLTTIASVLSGPMGLVVGYYFGKEK